MKQLALIGAIMLTFNCPAQDAIKQYNDHIIRNFTGEYIRVSSYRVKGSPYLFGESFPGKIKFKNGKLLSGEKIFYNLYDQKAGRDLNKKFYEELDPIDEFSLVLPEQYGNQDLFFKSVYSFPGANQKGYYNVLVDDSISLLKHYYISLIQDPVNEMDKDAKVFEQNFEYYLYNKSSAVLTKVKLKEKDLIKQGGLQSLYKEFIQKNNLDLSKETDAIKFIIYLNKRNP